MAVAARGEPLGVGSAAQRPAAGRCLRDIADQHRGDRETVHPDRESLSLILSPNGVAGRGSVASPLVEFVGYRPAGGGSGIHNARPCRACPHPLPRVCCGVQHDIVICVGRQFRAVGHGERNRLAVGLNRRRKNRNNKVCDLLARTRAAVGPQFCPDALTVGRSGRRAHDEPYIDAREQVAQLVRTRGETLGITDIIDSTSGAARLPDIADEHGGGLIAVDGDPVGLICCSAPKEVAGVGCVALPSVVDVGYQPAGRCPGIVGGVGGGADKQISLRVGRVEHDMVARAGRQSRARRRGERHRAGGDARRNDKVCQLRADRVEVRRSGVRSGVGPQFCPHIGGVGGGEPGRSDHFHVDARQHVAIGV